MIPLRDTIPSKRYPVVNNIIIGVNVLFYLIQLGQGRNLNRFVYVYGLVPAKYVVPQIAQYFSLWQQLLSLVTFMFLHGGFWHLLSNMWCLYIFGDNVEDRLGPFRYLAFYFICGILSGLSHLIINPMSNLPTIGASGAIAGVMGAYFLLYPNARILTLIPIIIIPWFIEIPAFIFLGIWFVLQFFNATVTQGAGSGIAWWAHIGGFICGMIFLKIFQAAPKTGLTDRVHPAVERKKTERLQVIHPSSRLDDPHLYGILSISPHEAIRGSSKLVNIPWGFHKRLFKVQIPAGVEDGKVLRLRGVGKEGLDGAPGDLFLKIAIQG